jgi:hypothetical protein
MATVNTTADYARLGLVRGTSWHLQPIRSPGELITGFRWVLSQHSPILPIQPTSVFVQWTPGLSSEGLGSNRGPILCPTEQVVRLSAQRGKELRSSGLKEALLCFAHTWGRQQRLSSLTGQQRDPEYALAHVCFSVLLLPPIPSPRPFGSRVRALVDACPGFRNLEHGFCRSVLYDLMVPHLKMRIRILIFE